MASPLTVYSTAADGDIFSYGATWSTVMSGGAAFEVHATAAYGTAGGYWTGSGNYYACLTYLDFDTSGIPDDATVTAATLTLNCHIVANHTVLARLKDWGTALTSADWVPIADLPGLTLLASKDFTGTSTNTDYALTSEAAFAANINKTGVTRMVLSTALLEAQTTPGLGQRVYPHMYESSSQIPKLVVTYTEASGTVPLNLLRPHIFNKGVMPRG